MPHAPESEYSECGLGPESQPVEQLASFMRFVNTNLHSLRRAQEKPTLDRAAGDLDQTASD